MSIAEAVDAAMVPKMCKFGQIIAAIAGPDAQAIVDGLETGLTNTDAARILTANGFPITEKAIRGHRATECRCGK